MASLGKCKRRTRRAFTLMEVLLVLVILVILGSMAGVFIRRAQQNAMLDVARSQIRMFEGPLNLFQMHMNRFPSTQEGLLVLVSSPSGSNTTSTGAQQWKGPYLEKSVIPKDPWGNDYQYELSNPDQYLISSWGPDGNQGTEDDIQSLQ